jgi:hypothetical protein
MPQTARVKADRPGRALKTYMQRLKHAALDTHLIPNHIGRTVEVMISHLHDRQTEPVAAIPVDTLIDKTGACRRTIQYHIDWLLAHGFARDARGAVGQRQLLYDGDLVAEAQGIDLSPFLERAAELEAARAAKNAHDKRKKATKLKISKARHQLKRLDAPVDADAAAFLASLPRRYEAMSLEALEALLDAIRSETERRLGRSKIADRSATGCRPTYTKENPMKCIQQGLGCIENDVRAAAGHTPPDEAPSARAPEEENPRPSRHQDREKTGDRCDSGETVVPDRNLLVATMPPEWHDLADWRELRANWTLFEQVARMRASDLGIRQRLIDNTIAEAGLSTAIAIVLLADTGTASGRVRSAPAWATTMAKRAAAGEARLVLSLQAELRRKSGRAA